MEKFDVKTEMYNRLSSTPFICLPEFDDYYSEGLGYKPKQKRMKLRFDSIQRIDKEGSIIDFVITKGESKLYIGLINGQFKPSPEDRKKIQKHGMPYLWIDCRFIKNAKAVESTIESSLVQVMPNDPVIVSMVKEFDAKLIVQTIHWFYHSKHGIHYGRKED